MEAAVPFVTVSGAPCHHFCTPVLRIESLCQGERDEAPPLQEESTKEFRNIQIFKTIAENYDHILGKEGRAPQGEETVSAVQRP